MAEYDNPDVFVFRDKSAVNNLTMQRCPSIRSVDSVYKLVNKAGRLHRGGQR
jgi:hypothetical protein